MTINGADVLVPAVSWVQAALAGSVATIIAILAVAAFGAMMLTGHIRVKRGATIVVGCFILFSASLITRGLLAGLNAPPADVVGPRETQSYSPTKPEALGNASLNPFDPYAGASVPQRKTEELPSIR